MPIISRPMRIRKKMKMTRRIFIANLNSFQNTKIRRKTPIKIIHKGMSARNSTVVHHRRLGYR